eukprot:CAMPEP_0196816952 /NCGR_PEP_ID=MMETSP1362-20130617/57796_1 /TAXON_ID=163516 /ORGANISM="Leptocylindrus danicus, Strain CCMP1856" /LENGTH=72 /DNA_ID=CAMNT_0042194447 /DNA_START=60 /DNA_END=278 /DNA_ORIENTATION=-
MGKDTGTDIKSLAINLASTLLFVLPFPAYFDTENLKKYAAGVGAAFLVAYVLPPVGWRRPHPYSDDATNVPS